MEVSGDQATAAQFKIYAKQAADMALADMAPTLGAIERAIARLNAALPEEGTAAISPTIKWIGALAGTVTGGLIMAALLWVASSVTDMQQTLARIDERQKAQTIAQDGRFDDFDRRITRLEKFHQLEGGGS